MIIPPKLLDIAAKAGIAIGAVLLLWLAVHLWFARHDASVIADDRNAANAEVSNRTAAADNTATAAKVERDDAFANDQATIQEKTDEATRAGGSPLDALFNQLR